MRPQAFPISFSELLDELMCVFLVEKVQLYLKGEAAQQPMAEILAIGDRYRRDYEMVRSHRVGNVG